MRRRLPWHGGLLVVLLSFSMPLAADRLEARIEAAQPLIESLRQRFREAPETLPVVGLRGHGARPLSSYHQRGCSLPELAYPLPLPTAVSHCVGPGVASSRSDHPEQRLWIVWEYRDGEWRSGQEMARQWRQRGTWGWHTERDTRATTRGGRELALPITTASAAQLQALGALWRHLATTPLEGLETLDVDFPGAWPPGLSALHRDGRLLLRDHRLAGLGDWQEWMAEQTLPDWVEGVAGVGVSRRSSYGEPPMPALLLATRRLGESRQGLVLVPAATPLSRDPLWASSEWALAWMEITEGSWNRR